MRALLLALRLPLCALAQEPDWLLVAPQRVVAGEPFELIVVAPPGAELPGELSLHVKLDLSDFPNLMAFQKRVAERPGVQAAMEAEGLNKTSS